MKKLLVAMIITLTAGAVFVFAQGLAFEDIEFGSWYFNAANFAKDHGYINGIQGNFVPGGKVTRDQIAVMLQKFAYNVHIQQGTKVFIDPWANFKLTFPASWQGYFYETEYGANSSIDELIPIESHKFGLINNDAVFEDLFYVSVWDKNDYVATEGPPGILAENDSYVIELSGSHEASTELNVARMAVEEIGDSFEWIE